MLILLKIPLCTTPNYNIGIRNWQLYIFTIRGHTKGKRKRGDTEMCHNKKNNQQNENQNQSQSQSQNQNQTKNQKNSRNKNNTSFS